MSSTNSGNTSRTALVTGASKRLGKAISLRLARAGMDIVLHYNTSRSEAKNLANEIRTLGVNAWTVKADLSDKSETSGLFEKSTRLSGKNPQILVNNASIFDKNTILDFSDEDLERNMQINALSPLALCRGFAALNGKSDSDHTDANIVNLLDCRIADYDREHAAYHLSKRMLHSITKMLALELAPEIRVNAVAPGLILPPEGEDEEYLKKLAHTNPLQKHGSTEDIAEAILFLTQSRFITGQTIYIDGGRNLKGNVYGL